MRSICSKSFLTLPSSTVVPTLTLNPPINSGFIFVVICTCDKLVCFKIKSLMRSIDRIKDLILKQTNLSQVHITTKINPELIGGFRVKVGTTVLDGSVKKDLEQIERKFRRVN